MWLVVIPKLIFLVAPFSPPQMQVFVTGGR